LLFGAHFERIVQMSILVLLAVLLAAFVLSMGLVPSRGYIPATDGDFDTWIENFSSTLTANPTGYGLTAGDATAVAATTAAWHTAYLAATAGGTRGPATIAAKNTSRASALIIVRPYAVTISQNQGISDMMKTAIGVTVRKVTPTPIGAPTTFPILSVIAATPLQFTMRASDQNSPDLRSKPFGAIGLQMFVTVSTTPITDPTILDFYANLTRQPMAIDFNSADAGKTAYIAARWYTKTGLVGPWSAIHQFTVANGA
jgi:hypothetical protein